jgi:hypothetical protein
MTSPTTANTPHVGYEPLQLVVEAFQEGVRVSVVGISAAEVRASFKLQVFSNGNQSVHEGSANLRGDKPEVLSAVSLPSVEQGQWRAHLSVQIEGAGAYEQMRTEITNTTSSGG